MRIKCSVCTFSSAPRSFFAFEMIDVLKNIVAASTTAIFLNRDTLGCLSEALIYSSHRRKPVSNSLIFMYSSVRWNDYFSFNQRFPWEFVPTSRRR